MSATLRTPLGFALALNLVACALGDSSTKVAETPCASDSTCPSGQVCLGTGFCGTPEKNLVVQVMPDPSTGLVEEEFNNPNTAQGSLTLQLDAPPSFSFSTPTECMVQLNGQSDYIPSAALYSVAPFDLTPQMSKVVATPSGAYQVLATPVDPTIPPFEIPAEQLAVGAQVPVTFSFPSPGTAATLSGTLVGPTVLNPPGLSAPTFEIQAYASTSPPVQLSQPVAVTEDGGFSFTLYLVPSTTPINLVLKPTSGVAPQVSLTGTVSALQSSIGDGGLSVGTATPVTASGMVVDSYGNPIPGATVTLVAPSLAGGVQFQSAPVLTDGGAFQVTVLRQIGADAGDSYLAQIVPPATYNAAYTDGIPLTVGDPVNGVVTLATITAQALVSTSGAVIDSTGAPVKGAQVLATPFLCQANITSGCSLPPSAQKQATTDLSGHFEFPTGGLSPGIYQFTITPPITQELPWGAFGPLPIGADGGSGSIPPVQLSPPQMVSGTVIGPTGSALSCSGTGAAGCGEINVYLLVSSMGTTGSEPTTIVEQIATSPIQSNGTFSVILPGNAAP